MSTSRPGGGMSKRRPSLPGSSAEAVLNDIDKPPPPVPRIAVVKHGKYIGLGGAGIWYTEFLPRMRLILEEERGWIRRIGVAAIGLHGFTIIIFLYLVVFLPWFRGYIPNYPKWQQSARLRTIVPVLTAAILLGWTSYVVSLSQAGKSSPLGALGDAVKAVGKGTSRHLTGDRGMGVWRAMAASTAVYILTLGILGFIPMPSNVPVGKKGSPRRSPSSSSTPTPTGDAATSRLAKTKIWHVLVLSLSIHVLLLIYAEHVDSHPEQFGGLKYTDVDWRVVLDGARYIFYPSGEAGMARGWLGKWLWERGVLIGE